MKKIIILVISLILGYNVHSATLVFNKIITYINTNYNPGGSSIYTTLGVVPVGKVWKIENATSGAGTTSFRLNNTQTNSFNYPISTPVFWMKENDSLGIVNTGGVSGYSFFYSVSIIEYNVIP